MQLTNKTKYPPYLIRDTIEFGLSLVEVDCDIVVTTKKLIIPNNHFVYPRTVKVGLPSKDKLLAEDYSTVKICIKWFIYAIIHELCHAQQVKDGTYLSLAHKSRWKKYKDKPLEQDVDMKVKKLRHMKQPTHSYLIHDYLDYIYD